MSNTLNTKQVLSEHKVIPDVLPEDFTPTYDLTLEWPSATLDTPGKELGREETQPEPKVTITPPPSGPLSNLVLLCVDPDLMMNNDTYFGQVRHWLVTNLSANTDGTLSHATASNRSPYIGPAPLPNYLYSRPHRYIFILARARAEEKVDVRPEDLQAIQQRFVAAVTGKQDQVQDLKDRWGFDTQAFLENFGLDVLGVNFMRVAGTARSAVANAGMMGEAAANLVVGK